jgi:hypothetical protein
VIFADRQTDRQIDSQNTIFSLKVLKIQHGYMQNENCLAILNFGNKSEKSKTMGIKGKFSPVIHVQTHTYAQARFLR